MAMTVLPFPSNVGPATAAVGETSAAKVFAARLRLRSASPSSQYVSAGSLPHSPPLLSLLLCKQIRAQVDLGLCEPAEDVKEAGVILEHGVSFDDRRHGRLSEMRVGLVVERLQEHRQVCATMSACRSGQQALLADFLPQRF